MTTQGAASNRNGKALERRVAGILVDAEVPFESQKKRYPGPNPEGHQHDFIVDVDGEPVVIECKSFSGMAGTLWEKLAYTIHVLSCHGVRCILVLGGDAPNDWRREFLVGYGRDHDVEVLDEGQFREMVQSWRA